MRRFLPFVWLLSGLFLQLRLFAQFSGQIVYPTGTSPIVSASADFNNDGIIDLATSNYFAVSVSIRLGTGGGAFGPAVTYPLAGSRTGAVAAGDLNKDGNLDLVLAEVFGTRVFVLLGKGDGTFLSYTTYNVNGNNPYFLAVDDLNGDGNNDVAVENSSGGISVFYGNGDGTLQPPQLFNTGANPYHVVISDINKDGRKDMLTANLHANTISVLLNNGNGTFAPNVDYVAGSSCSSLALYDFNKDGNLDVAVSSSGTNSMAVLFGNGAGQFGSPTYYPTTTSSYFLTAADFDNDGNGDICVANYNNSTVTVFKGSANGTFLKVNDIAIAGGSQHLLTGDFNTDGRTDVISTNYVGNSFSVLFNNGPFPAQPAGALHVDGTNDYISIPHNPKLNLSGGDYTVEFWAKPTIVDGTFRFLISKDNTNSNLDYLIGVNNTNRWRFISRNLSNDITGGPVVTAGTWYHVAAIFDNGTAKLYVNGQLAGSAPIAGSPVSSTANLLIGARTASNPNAFFAGEVDELRIWNRALCEAEVAAWNNCSLSGTEAGLVAYYRFNQGDIGAVNSSVTTVNDATVNQFNGTLTNFALAGTTSNWVAGKVSGNCASGVTCPIPSTPAGALDFDGADDFVQVNDNSVLDFGSNNFSIEFWALKKTTTTNWDGTVVGKWNTGGAPGTNEWAVSLSSNITGDVPGFVVESGNTLKLLTSSEPIVVGAWTHIACVRDGQLLKIYLNAQLKGTLDIGPGFVVNNVGRNLLIGKILAGFNSAIKVDELRIWNKAICQEEVQARMNCELTGSEANLVAYYRFNQGTVNTTNAGTTTLTDATANQLHGTLYNFALNGSTSNWVAGNVTGTCQTTTVSCPPTPATLLNPELWLKADAGVSTSGSAVTQWLDQSGFNRHATATNVQFLPTAYNGKPALNFTGNGGLTTTAFATFPNKRGTIFVVSKTNGPGIATGVGYGTLVSTYFGSEPTWQFGATTGALFFYDGVTPVKASADATSPTVFGISTLLRNSNTTLQYLRNGSLDKTIPVADNQPAINALKIGWNGSAERLVGDIAEIIVYGRALSASEIGTISSYLGTKYNISIAASTAPAISLNKSSLNFGNLGLGFSLTDRVIITNTGTAPLSLSGIASSNPAYSLVYSKNTIAPNDTGHVVIRYTPSSAGPSSGSIILTHNAAGSPTAIAVQGTAVSTGYTYQVNTIPGLNSELYGATWFNSQIGFVSGANGKLYRTANGGGTWTQLPFNGNVTLRSIRKIGSVLWLFGSNGHICVSYDEGQTFVPFTTNFTGTFYDGYFVNAYYGFAVGSNGTICRYNGTAWEPYSLPVTNNFYGVYAWGNRAWAVGSGGIVCRYNVATNSWEPVNPGVSNDILGVAFWNEDFGYIVGSNGLLCRTYNGGTTWQPLNSGVDADIRSIKILSAAVAWAVAGNGQVLQTTDGGNTWVKLPLGPFNFERVDFNDCQGIAICHNGAVVTFQSALCNNSYNPYYVRRSTGGGGYGYRSAWWGSSGNGGVAGRFGNVLFTGNGGQSWRSTNPFTTQNIYALRIFGNTSFIAGSGGYIATCNRLGENWVPFTGIPSNITFYSMAFYPNGTGWAVGSGGTICYYNGTGWAPYNTGGIQNTFRCVYVIGNVAYAVGTNGIICKYNGTAWVDVSPGVSNDFYGCAFVTPEMGYAVGSSGIICKTIDGGKTWFPITTCPTTEDLLAVEVGCRQECVVAGRKGVAYQTADGGANWTDRSLQREVDINSITLLDGEGLLATEEGEAYTFAFGGQKPTATLTANGPTTFCQGGKVSLTASGGTAYLWSTGEETASIEAASSGVYKVTVSTEAGCSDEKEIQVTVNPLPEITFNLQPAVCINAGAVALTAAPTGGSFSGPGVSGASFSPVAAGLGEKKITYSYTNENGCSQMKEAIILVNPAPQLSFALQASVCVNGAPVALTASPAGGTFSGPGVNSNTFNPAAAGTGLKTITYTYTDGNGCSSNSSQSIEVLAAPAVNAGADVTVFYGYQPRACTQLQASASGGKAPYSFGWSNGVAGSANYVCPTTTTTYTITAVDGNGCRATDDVVVTAEDVRCNTDKKVHKVTICHVEPRKQNITICVDENAVAAHLAHGDYLGECDANKGTVDKEAAVGAIVTADASEPLLYPNPTRGRFSVQPPAFRQSLRIRVVDAQGKVIEEKLFRTKAPSVITMELSKAAKGFYIVQFIADGKTKQTKLVIQ